MNGCSSDDGGGDSGDSTEPSPLDIESLSVGADPCAVLDDADIEALAGEPLKAKEVADDESAIPACSYGGGATKVEVQKVSTDAYALTLPGAVAAAGESTDLDDDTKSRLEEAAAAVEDGETLAPDDVCGYFEDLQAASGETFTDGVSLTYPEVGGARTAAAVSCLDGWIVTVTVVKRGIKPGGELAETLTQALSGIS